MPEIVWPLRPIDQPAEHPKLACRQCGQDMTLASFYLWCVWPKTQLADSGSVELMPQYGHRDYFIMRKYRCEGCDRQVRVPWAVQHWLN